MLGIHCLQFVMSLKYASHLYNATQSAAPTKNDADRRANADPRMASTQPEFRLNEKTGPPGLGGRLSFIRFRRARGSTRQRARNAGACSPAPAARMEEI